MAGHRKNSANRRKKPSGKRPLVTLFIIVILIALAFYFLETLKRTVPVKVSEQPVAVERYKMPVRTGDVALEQQPYTSAVTALAPKRPRKRPAGPGTVAIIVDDMGSSMQEIDALMAIKLPLTFSIIPGLPHVKEVAEVAHARGFEVMVHMPMEPQGYPQQRMEKNGLLLSQSDAEIQARVNGFLRAVPYATGANNHMGSRFTEDKEKMTTVLTLLKGRGLFFIDSRTSPHSVGYALARELGLDTAARNVFLDNVQDVEAIRGQLEQLAGMARRKGVAIGICHPHKSTILALTGAMPELQRQGITFVYAADLVK